MNPCIQHQKKASNDTACPNYINYCLKSEVSMSACSTCYTAVQIKYCSKSTSAIKVAIIKSIDDFCYKRKSSCAITKLTQQRWMKHKEGHIEECILHIEDTSRAKIMLNSEKIRSVYSFSHCGVRLVRQAGRH